jgi:hypothetical protein
MSNARSLVGWSVIALLASGCASLKDASAGQVGCKPSEIQISDERSGWSTRTWTATCRGRRYSCAYVQTGATYGSGSGGVVSGSSGQVNCSPMDAPRQDRTARRRTTPAATAATSGGSRSGHGEAANARTERAFDEGRGVHVVRGQFQLDRSMRLHLVGIPQMALGRVAVFLRGYSPEPRIRECEGLEVLVNEQPFASDESKNRTKGTTVNLESRFDFEVFKPLSQQYSTFGSRACGRKWKVAEDQMEELKKFFVIYAQIAQQVQKGELPEVAAEAAGDAAAGDGTAGEDAGQTETAAD